GRYYRSHSDGVRQSVCGVRDQRPSVRGCSFRALERSRVADLLSERIAGVLESRAVGSARRAPASTATPEILTMHTPSRGLYKDSYERDSCGLGLIASLDDAPSHWLIRTAITSLNRLTHRGAIAADGKTGDGCGLLLKQPERFLRAIAAECGIALGRRFASGLVFLAREEGQAAAARQALECELTRQGLEVAGWRTVPTDAQACGAAALKSLPRIEQLFVNCAAEPDQAAFNRRLFMARRLAEKACARD